MEIIAKLKPGYHFLDHSVYRTFADRRG